MTEPLLRDWTFVPGPRAPWRVLVRRLHARLRKRVPAPAHAWLELPSGTGAWTCWFVWLPDGRLTPAHRFTLDRLRALGRRLLVVCATPDPSMIPADLAAEADALAWKDMPGFDFSAYALGLHGLAAHAPSSDVLVLNDSVYGPFVDLQPFLDAARWDLTGFTATANVENHVQSYAFVLRDVTPARMAALASVLPRDWAYDRFWDVVLGQETRFARVAARSMSVGAFRYAPAGGVEDPTLGLALPLLDDGLPFLKRSLVGKLAHLDPDGRAAAALARLGHPSDANS